MEIIVFVFKIKNNTEEEYARFLRFIEKLELTTEDIVYEDVQDVDYYFKSLDERYENEEEIFKYYINAIEKTNLPLNKIQKPENIFNFKEKVNNGTGKIYYHFQVIPTQDDNNVVNFIHYFLIKQRFRHSSMVVYMPDDNFYFKLSHFLWHESKRLENVNCLYAKFSDGKLKKFAQSGITKLEYFFPLFQIDSNSYRNVLKISVAEVLERLFSSYKKPGEFFQTQAYRYSCFHFEQNFDSIPELAQNISGKILGNFILKEIKPLNNLANNLNKIGSLDELVDTINGMLDWAENKTGSSENSWLKILQNFLNQTELRKKIWHVDLDKGVNKTVAKIIIVSALLHYLSEGRIPILPMIQTDLEELPQEAFMLQMCLNYLNPKYLDSSKKSDIDMGKVYDEVKKIPLLALLLFASNLGQKKSSVNKADWDDLIGSLKVAVKQAEGMLQLIENVAHHAENKRGYLSFRLYRVEKNSSEERNDSIPFTNLKARYPGYFSSDKIERISAKENITEYLEVFIFDYSHQGIVDTLVGNFVKNFSTNPILDNGFLNLSVRDFFNLMEKFNFWSEYYKSKQGNFHYGLRSFNSVVESVGGYFEIVSIKKHIVDAYCSLEYETTNPPKNIVVQGKSFVIPGTKYTILMPVYAEFNDIIIDDTAVEVKRNLTNEFKEVIDNPYKQAPCNLDINFVYKDQEEKNSIIYEGAKQVLSKINSQKETEPHYFVSIDLRKIDSSQIEIISKVIFQAIQMRDKESNNHTETIIVLYGLNEKLMQECIYQFIQYYEILDFCKCMRKAWIYIYGHSRQEEYIIHGETPDKLRKINQALVCMHGYVPEWIDKINPKPHNSFVINNIEFKSLKIKPFSTYTEVDSATGETLFEQFTRKALESDIELPGFGVKIPNTHVRIGSKIHITQFYEAELLFQNNYFVDRFAYLIAKDLFNLSFNLPKEKFPNQKLLLVGYASYSEMLVNRIQSLLEDKEKFSKRYLFCEDTSSLTFRYLDWIDDDIESYALAFIVPIGTTLTTHNKMLAGLERAVNEKNKNNGKDQIRLDKNLVYNISVILVRDGESGSNSISDQEKEYNWENIDLRSRKVVATKLIEPDVHYLISVNGAWRDPLKCKYCYPDDPVDEIPLLETNKSSVIPFTVLGLKGNNDESKYKNDKHSGNINVTNEKRVETLKDALYYQHIIRDDNHYLYYFDTDQYFYDNKDDIKKWLQSFSKEDQANIKRDNSDEAPLEFNFIITPIHHTNMGFVNAVNDEVFKGDAQIIRFEVNKEFRQNIKTKYSNLRLLFNKLNPSQQFKASINFHFVDDTVVTGATISRARSMIRSIFAETEASNAVQVKVFSSIIVLINRSSKDSQKDYMAKYTQYQSYVELYISSIKNPAHFCFMCSNQKERTSLQNCSATIAMRKYWQKKVDKLEPIQDYDLDMVYKPGKYEKNWTNREKIQVERCRNRMVRSHIAGRELNRIGATTTDHEKLFQMIQNELILKEISVNQEQATDIIIDNIKIFSRPMLSYRKNVREAIFKLMLRMLDVLLGAEKSDLHSDLTYKIKEIRGNKKEKAFALLLVLMKQLTILNSNFIMRKENIQRIWQFYDDITVENWENDGLKTYYDCFELKYTAMVKRLVCLYDDESKSTWLEYLLLKNEEMHNEMIEKTSKISENTQWKTETRKKYYNFMEILLIENTTVLKSAIDDLQRNCMDCKKCKEYRKSGDSKLGCSELIAIIDDIDSKEREYSNRIKTDLEQYYFENFKKILKWHGYPKDNDETISLVGNIVLLSGFLSYKNCKKQSESDNDVEKDYNLLAKLVNRIIIDAKKTVFSFQAKEKGDLGSCIIGNSLGESAGGSKWLEKSSNTYKFGKIKSDETYKIFTENPSGQNECIIRYLIPTQNRFAAFTIYFPKDVKPDTIIKKIRYILLFTHSINEMLNADFRNDSIQNWLEEKERRLLLSSNVKSSDHSTVNRYTHALIEVKCNDISKLSAGYLRQLADSFISRQYTNLINEKFRNGGYNKAFSYTLNSILLDYEDKIRDGCEGEYGKKTTLNILEETRKSRIKIIRKDNLERKINHEDLLFILVQLIRNAVKFGDGTVDVYEKDKYLIIHNIATKKNDIQKIKRKILERDLNDIGITLYTVFGLIKAIYNDEVKLLENGKFDYIQNSNHFYVGLPILDIGDE